MLTGELSTPVNIKGEIYRGIGTTDYNDLENKPTYNGHIIEGDLTSESLGIWQPKNFSTEEQNTGLKWIDGKNVYIKIIHTTSVQGDSGYILGSIDNHETIIVSYGMFKRLNFWYNCDGRTESPKYNSYYVKIDITPNGDVTLGYGGYSSNEFQVVNVIILYTKVGD